MQCSALGLSSSLLLIACGGAAAPPDDAGAMDAAVMDDAGATPVSDAGPPDDTADPEALAAAYAREACAKARRCEALFGRELDAVCHPDYRSHFWQAMIEAWRAGRGDYDRDAARACLDAVASDRCDRSEIDPPPTVCADAFVGNVPEGGACARGPSSLGWQCVRGLDCVTEGACPGRCAARARLGEPCSGVQRCDGSLGLHCEEGECIVYPGVGEPCENYCAGEALCHGGVCVPTPTLGEPCGDELPRCRRPYRCRPDGSGGDVCSEVLGTREGDYCRQLFARCDYPLICQEIPLGERPERETDGICTRGAEFGETCDDRTPCGPGGRCVRGRCAEIAEPLGACDVEHVCPTTHECVNGACQPRPGSGERCDDSVRCAFDSCVDGVCEPRWPNEGEPCPPEIFQQCDLGLECGGDFASPVCRVPCL